MTLLPALIGLADILLWKGGNSELACCRLFVIPVFDGAERSTNIGNAKRPFCLGTFYDE